MSKSLLSASFPFWAFAPHVMIALVHFSVFVGCSRDALPLAAQNAASNGSPAAPAASASAAAGGDCVVKYGRPRPLARLDDKKIDESSGIARSLVRDGAFWTHNDGNTPRLYCIDKEGETLAIVKLEGAKFVDCEDIAAFTRDGKNYLLYADTGDNELDRREYQLHLFEEPPLTGNAKGKAKRPQEVPVAMTIPFRFPDGSQDCEAAAVDPTSGKVYLATKERSRGSQVYELDLPATAPTQRLEAKLIARLEMRSVAAMDISPDGRRAVVLTDRAAFEFARRTGESWPAAFRRRSCLVPTPLRQNGESICYGADGRTLYLTSEGRGEPLWEIPAE